MEGGTFGPADITPIVHLMFWGLWSIYTLIISVQFRLHRAPQLGVSLVYMVASLLGLATFCIHALAAW